MIEREHDRVALFEEMGLEVGGILEADRQEMLDYQPDPSDEELNDPWANDLTIFMQELAEDPNIEGLAFSSFPTRLVHIDYFCQGEDGLDMSQTIATIEGLNDLIGETPGSIRWLDRRNTFEVSEKSLRAQLSADPENKELLLIVKFV